MEDRAPWRHDPSANPGTKTEGGRHDAAPVFPFGIGTNAVNRGHVAMCSEVFISPPPVCPFHAEPLQFRGYTLSFLIQKLQLSLSSSYCNLNKNRLQYLVNLVEAVVDSVGGCSPTGCYDKS